MNNKNSDVAMYFLAKLGPALQGFLSIFLITKSLSPENYGKYSLVITLLLLATQLLGSWLNQAQFYFLPKRRTQQAELLAWFGQANLYVSLIGSLGIFGLLQVLKVDADVALAGAAVFFAQMWWNYMSTHYQSLEQPKIQLVASAYQVAVQIILILALFYFKKLTILTALTVILSGFSAGLLLFLKRNGPVTRETRFVGRKAFFRYFRLAVGYGAPFSLWFLFCQVYTFSDRLFLSEAGFSDDVGRYAAARDLLLGVTSMLAMPLLMVAHPMIMRLWADGKAAFEIEKVINKSLTIIFVAGVFFCTVLLAYGGKVFSILLPSKYKLLNIEYALIGCAIFFSVGSMYAHKAMEVSGRTLRMAYLGGAVAVFNISANSIFVPEHGLSAVIAVNLMSQIAYFTGAAWMSRNCWRVFVSAKRVLAAIFTAGIVFFIGQFIDASFPEPISDLLPLPWGLVCVSALLLIGALTFPEVNSMFRRTKTMSRHLPA